MFEGPYGVAPGRFAARRRQVARADCFLDAIIRARASLVSGAWYPGVTWM